MFNGVLNMPLTRKISSFLITSGIYHFDANINTVIQKLNIADI